MPRPSSLLKSLGIHRTPFIPVRNAKHRCLDFDLLFFHLWTLFWEKTLKNKRAPQVIRTCNKTRTITREFTYMILNFQRASVSKSTKKAASWRIGKPVRDSIPL